MDPKWTAAVRHYVVHERPLEGLDKLPSVNESLPSNNSRRLVWWTDGVPEPYRQFLVYGLESFEMEDYWDANRFLKSVPMSQLRQYQVSTISNIVVITSNAARKAQFAASGANVQLWTAAHNSCASCI